jgi:hypothetical protein
LPTIKKEGPPALPAGLHNDLAAFKKLIVKIPPRMPITNSTGIVISLLLIFIEKVNFLSRLNIMVLSFGLRFQDTTYLPLYSIILNNYT